MNIKQTLLSALALTLPLAGATAVTLTSNTALSPGDTTYDGADIIVSNCTLTVNGAHSFASLVLTNGAVLTHSPAPAGEPDNRLDLTITGNLVVDATSRIDADGKGYGTQTGPGAGTFDLEYPSGAGHGGPGGNGHGVMGGASYGALLAPATWGSGGGGDANFPGGAGGGRVRLEVAGTLTVDGQLSANGQSVWKTGGAGGSIHIIAGTLAGSGSITADGGNAEYVLAGGGGGGRIAIYDGNSTFSGRLMAIGGLSALANSGGAGTVYTKAGSQSFGDLLLDNSGRTNAMETLLTAPALYRLTLTNATAYVSAPLTVAGLRVSAGALLTHPFQGPRLQVRVQGNAVVEGGGEIAAEARGYPANTGPGHGSYGNDVGSGAGHGGPGGASGWGPGGGVTYDSLTEPIDFGSGGGGGATPIRGGGAIQLTVEGTLTVDGRVSVNADAPAGGYDGGGSGGSVWLTAGRLNGAGSITANGQLAAYPGAGSGGGGRIAIYAGVNQFSGTVVASGGMGGYRPGSAGTTYYATNVPSGLVSWWPGEGSAEDIAGPNEGTTVGGATFAPGIVGQAFEFTADSAGVTIPHDASLNVSPSGFSAEFWIQGVKNQPQSLFLAVDKSHGWVDSTGWLFQGYSDSGQIFFGIGAGGEAINNFPLATSSTDILDGQWHHVAGTWDGAILRIFVDGLPQDQAALTTPFNNTRPVNIGLSWGGGSPNRFFRGKVDELKIYNRALTTNEIAAIYAAGSSGNAPPPALGLTLATGGVLFSWPASAEGYGLVACADLRTGSWETVTNEPTLNGTQKEVLLPIVTVTNTSATGSQFFRLHKP